MKVEGAEGVGAGGQSGFKLLWTITQITPEARRGPSEQQPVILRKLLSTTLALSCFICLDDYTTAFSILLANGPDYGIS